MITLKEALFSRKNIKSNPYGLTQDDLKGDLEGFPIGVVVRMLEEQEAQGNKPDVKVFQSYWGSERTMLGFDWRRTEAGRNFWEQVLNRKKWNEFFDKYPEYKMYNL